MCQFVSFVGRCGCISLLALLCGRVVSAFGLVVWWGRSDNSVSILQLLSGFQAFQHSSFYSIVLLLVLLFCQLGFFIIRFSASIVHLKKCKLFVHKLFEKPLLLIGVFKPNGICFSISYAIPISKTHF